jgi:protein TonB
MEIKKSPNADLESHKAIYVLVGLALALSSMLYAFEYTSVAEKIEEFSTESVAVEEEIIPITRQDEIKPPPPPPPQQQQISDVLEIVEDDVEIEDEFEVIDVEATENQSIQVVEVEVEEEEAPIFFIVEQMPEFPGGELELRKYIAENVNYPAVARENNIQGRVYVRFVVTTNGSVDQVSVARGVDPLLDAEAIRVVKGLPKWTPGKQRGQAVNVWYTVPINFQLQ